MSRNKVDVLIGQIKLVTGTGQLCALLGSCVGIAMICEKQNVVALAHCLLPYMKQPQTNANARYVDHAILSLIELMGIKKMRERANVKVILAGGSSMIVDHCKTRKNRAEKSIGQQNIEAANTILRKENFEVIHEDTGGFKGRRIIIDCSTKNFLITTFNRSVI